MSKLVGIYERKGQIFVSAFHKTQAGFWIGGKNTIKIDRDNTEILSQTIVAALSESRNDVPTPPRNFDPTASLLIAAGVSSWSTFAKLAKSVSVELHNGVLEIIPEQNKGSREGFIPMTDKAVKLSEDSNDLGSAVLAALEVAE